MQLTDAKQRQTALNTEQSFIVQAPAGSGKTELLTRRFLVLLTTVEQNPEEVLAITFTRKAANEMRLRIIKALQLGLQPKPDSEYKQQTWQIARQVLQRDKAQNWQLLNNPNRLRIQTIDSLCMYLSRQLPLLSQLGSNVELSDDTEQDYQQAVDAVLTGLEKNNHWTNDLTVLQSHLDNNIETVKELLANMLSHRDQWLPYVIATKSQDDVRQQLQHSLQQVINQSLNELAEALPAEEHTEIIGLINHANASDIKQLPNATHSNLTWWQTFASKFLTKKYQWRAKLTKNDGFPTKTKNKAEEERLKDLKQRMLDLIQRLSDKESLRERLKQCLLLPTPEYSEQQWQVLQAMLELLPILAAQLNLIFQQRGHIDYIELTQRALRALSDDNLPTDLALCLDYKIKHILVDEFQDTSATQFRLLELLTRGWQQDDGRTLFLVGDPMQSIYRFRAAEVGLFLQAKQYGIGSIPLVPLTLQSNFRSQHTIVQWFNTTFNHAFPAKDNMTLGAISYSEATAIHEDRDSKIHYHHTPDNNAEALKICQVIEQSPEATIAILVKSKKHLSDIIPQLKQFNIPFQAVEIDALAHLPFIQDLYSLASALNHFADRIAWLAVLRAPWCGLCLSDLHQLANPYPQRTIWQCINDQELFNQLTPDGQQRLESFCNTFHSVLAQRGRMSFSSWVKVAWLALGGPATLRPHDNIDDTEVFFDLLSKSEQGGTLPNPEQFELQLAKLFAQAKTEPCNVQLMTIHKAKGLEFDIVILPQLHRKLINDKSKLLLWQEFPSQQHDINLLLAPIKAKQTQEDAIYKYVKQFQQRKNQFEYTRLFYVAATRAKAQLHLLAQYDLENPKENKNSFLHIIESLYRDEFITTDATMQNDIKNEKSANLRRFTKPYQLPDTLATMLPTTTLRSTVNANMPKWQSDDERKRGIVLHRILQALSETNHSQWQDIINNQPLHIALLRHQAITDLASALAMLQTALQQVAVSETAAWILNNQHQAAASEFLLHDQKQNYYIDRTFIDNNTRWIIDYKSATPEQNESIDVFLQRQYQLHAAQLEHYATLMADIDNRPIKLMLYFPLIDQSYVWTTEQQNETIAG